MQSGGGQTVAKARSEVEVEVKLGGDDIVELRKLTERLEKAIIDGRGLLKDLNHERKALKEFIDDEVSAQCVLSANAAIERMTKTIQVEMDRSVAKVGAEFEELKNLYTGRTADRAGQPTMEDLTSFAKVIDYMKREGKMPEWLI